MALAITPLMPQRATDAVPGWLFELFGRERPASDIVLVAGPCSVSRLDQTVRVAQVVAAAGATAYRGGAFKPRSRPDAFQGAGADGLEMLRAAKAATGLPIVTELLDIRDLEAVLAVADIIQVGARNMHNTPLLKELGRTGCPVLLKRGMSATIDETVGAAEYVLCEGNPWVILCERGIRTFETAYRFTLDLMAVPMLQERLGLPVIVDPSHAPGRRELVTRLSKAAIAIGADGIIVEVDENPDDALSDGPQQLSSAEFAAYATEIHRAASTEGRQVARAA